MAKFHEEIRAYEPGRHAEARAHARRAQSDLAIRLGGVRLNPKIDSKAQRRLQASVRMSDLESTPGVAVAAHRDAYRGLTLPVILESGPRVFSGA